MKISASHLTFSFLLCLILFTSCSDKFNDEQELPIPIDTEQVIQEIELNPTDYKHQFIGGGVSIGLFLGHHYSMDSQAQDKAIQFIAKDCNMKYLQDYIQIYPKDDPEYFDRRANYVKASKVYRPEIEFSLVGNKFPDNLLTDFTVNGEVFQMLNTNDDSIYFKLAHWWFELFKGFKERGVDTEILNVVNEPDLNRNFRKYHYGLDGNTKEAVAQIFLKAVPEFLSMFDDPLINYLGMTKPKIMGPSTLSPKGCINYIDFFMEKHPKVWELIDIVSTHQYENGGNAEFFRAIYSRLEGKAFYQSETHALKGDGLNLEAYYISRDVQTTLSLFNLFATAVNNGVSAWFYFENNYPNVEVHPGGLLSIPWEASSPVPYKHYYAFKQLTTSQPSMSRVIPTFLSKAENSEAIAFRKEGNNKIYLHFANYDVKEQNLKISLSDGGLFLSYDMITTDIKHNDFLIASDTFSAKKNINLKVSSFSVNTIELTIAD